MKYCLGPLLRDDHIAYLHDAKISLVRAEIWQVLQEVGLVSKAKLWPVEPRQRLAVTIN